MTPKGSEIRNDAVLSVGGGKVADEECYKLVFEIPLDDIVWEITLPISLIKASNKNFDDQTVELVAQDIFAMIYRRLKQTVLETVQQARLEARLGSRRWAKPICLVAKRWREIWGQPKIFKPGTFDEEAHEIAVRHIKSLRKNI